MAGRMVRASGEGTAGNAFTGINFDVDLETLDAEARQTELHALVCLCCQVSQSQSKCFWILVRFL